MRRFAPDPLGLLELWRHEAPRTLRIFGVFLDEDLAYRAPGGGRSVGELLGHVIASYGSTGRWLIRDRRETPPTRPSISRVADAGQELARAQRDLFDALSRLAPEAFDEVVAPFGVAETLGVMAFGMLKHELHHRGELHALARVCARTVPSLYEPV